MYTAKCAGVHRRGEQKMCLALRVVNIIILPHTIFELDWKRRYREERQPVCAEHNIRTKPCVYVCVRVLRVVLLQKNYIRGFDDDTSRDVSRHGERVSIRLTVPDHVFTTFLAPACT